jgi:chromosome segregation ATPase
MSEIEQLKLESETNVQRLTSKYQQEIEMERERARQVELASQQRYECEKTNMIMQIESMEMRERELKAKQFNYEQVLQEISYHNNSLQGELAKIKSEMNQFKVEKDRLDRKLHLSEKYINDLDLEIREQKRDLKDKTDQIARLQENLSSEQAKRRQLEEMPNNKQIPIIRKTV